MNETLLGALQHICKLNSPSDIARGTASAAVKYFHASLGVAVTHFAHDHGWHATATPERFFRGRPDIGLRSRVAWLSGLLAKRLNLTAPPASDIPITPAGRRSPWTTWRAVKPLFYHRRRQTTAVGLAILTAHLPEKLSGLDIFLDFVFEIANERMKIRQLALTDPLTGLGNRRLFEEVLHAEIARSMRHSRPLSLLLIDLRGFKTINERFGYRTGDEALKNFAAWLRRRVRQSDTVARIGGDEMAIICPETDEKGAHQLAERLEQSGANIELLPGISVSVRVAAATWQPGESAEDFYRRAAEDLAAR